MSTAVNVNGQLFDREHAAISVFDHGFLYGEGIYEVLRTYNGRPFLLDRHLRRLHRSAEQMALDVPLSDSDIGSRIDGTIAAAGLGEGKGEAYVRLMITRGIGAITYDPAACPVASVVVIVQPHIDPPAEVYTRGVRVALVGVVRNHPGTVNPMIKSNNLMNSALGMQEAMRLGAFEAVMRNYRGEIAECSTSNIFVVKDGTALTPPLDAGLLPGITREFMFDIGREAGMRIEEHTLYDSDVFGADEVFLTSTTREIVPIVKVDESTIGNGVPGPVTLAWLREFRRRTSPDPRATS